MITMTLFTVWWMLSHALQHSPLFGRCEDIAVALVLVTVVLDACVQLGLLIALGSIGGLL